MEYRTLGRSGVKVSPVCLGCMNFGGATSEADSIQIIHTALEAGINFVDTANVYNGGQSEIVTGKALQGRRDQVILATKAWGKVGEGPNDQGGSRLHILKACEDSLRRLNTDYIDLYQIHRPSFDIPQEETLRALETLVSQGKVRYIGSSTHPAWFLMESLSISERLNLHRYITEQPPYNLLDRRIEIELVPFALRYGLAILPWAPLAQGLLAGRYPSTDLLPPDSRAVRTAGSIYAERVTTNGIAAGQRFTRLAHEAGISPGQLALLWCKDQPGITSPIIGPRTLEQLQDLLPVLEMKLGETERQACDEINPSGSALVNFHNTAGWMKGKIS